CHSDMGGPTSDHAEDRSKHAAHGSHLPAIGIADGGKGVVVAEQLVGAVDKVDFQWDSPEKTIRSPLPSRHIRLHILLTKSLSREHSKFNLVLQRGRQDNVSADCRFARV